MSTAHEDQFAPDPNRVDWRYDIAFQIGYLRASARIHRDENIAQAVRELEALLQPILDPRNAQ